MVITISFRGRILFEIFTSLFFTPLARLFSIWSPAIFTWSSLVAGCLAGLAFLWAGFHPSLYLAAGLLVAISGACDSLDGIIARMNSRTNRRGDFPDHLFDRIIDISILSGLAWSPGASSELGLFCLVLVLLNAYLATQIQASYGQRLYKGIGKPELFTALVILSVLLWSSSEPLFALGTLDINYTNLFFIILAALALSPLKFFSCWLLPKFPC